MMNKLLISLVVTLGLATGAQAAGDAKTGKTLSAACGACHGADGNSLAPSFPKLAGQGERYLVKQLKDFKSGARANPIMAGQVAGLNEQQMADISAYFASQTGTTGQAKADLVELGERLFRAGNEEKGIPACMACHGPSGKGMAGAGFPALAGQHAGYIKAQLNAFSAETRTNDGESRMMRDVARRMHNEEIEAVSSYIQGLN
jgi:cytochrome c553